MNGGASEPGGASRAARTFRALKRSDALVDSTSLDVPVSRISCKIREETLDGVRRDGSCGRASADLDDPEGVLPQAGQPAELRHAQHRRGEGLQ